MGLFDIFKKAAAPQKPEALSVSCPAGSILAPVAGKAIALEKVSDMVFNSDAASSHLRRLSMRPSRVR